MLNPQIELVQRFFNGKYSMRSEYKDLYQAITCYRMYDTLEDFIDINPELADNRTALEELWGEMDTLTDTELSEVALDLLGASVTK